MPTFEAADELVPLALPELHTWIGRPTPEALAPLPGAPAILLLLDERGAPVQLLTTQALKRLVASRLAEPPPEEARRGRTDLAEIVRGVRWRAVTCPFEARWWYYRLARALHPRAYRDMIGFGPAWFLHADLGAAVPELRVTERVGLAAGDYLGPWPSHREAQQALEGLWDLFDLCRYPEQVRRAPHGTRCAYAEMGRCDAPCDGSAPMADYRARCEAAWRFACGGAAEWMAAAAERMRTAAAALEFERAGLLKQQLAFEERWRTDWAPRLHRFTDLHYLVVLPVARRRSRKLFLFRAGHLLDGPIVPDRKVAPPTLAWLSAVLPHPAETMDETARMEQTWLFAHLLFSREAETALLVHLPAGHPPADLAERVAQRVAAKPRPQESGGDQAIEG